MKNLTLFFLLALFSCNIKTVSISEDYKLKQVETINQLLNNWHKAAAEADLENYFNKMTDDAIYLGTDASERWTKDEFLTFCNPYFDKGKAWDFIPYNRQIYYSKDGKTIWFDELLKTWMGVCRGSGVIRNDNNTFKITHYHLSVTIKNEKVKEFLQINQN